MTLLTLATLAGSVCLGQAQTRGEATWGFELRLGAYQPAVGDQIIPNTSRDERDYYREFFGRGSPLLLGLEFDRYLVHLGGPLGVFFRVGHWKASGKTRVCRDGAGQAVGCTPETIFDSVAGGGKTQLQIVPLGLGAVYRLDLLKRYLHVPLVPYGKAGLDYYYWKATVDGESSSFTGPSGGGDGSGGTLGAHAAVGLALNLDWISTDGEQHNVFLDSAFFVEATKIWADGFGNERKFDMSAEQLMFGLSFDFE